MQDVDSRLEAMVEPVSTLQIFPKQVSQPVSLQEVRCLVRIHHTNVSVEQCGRKILKTFRSLPKKELALLISVASYL